MSKDKRPWIALFSQTGSEIVDIADSLGRWPEVIITNKRPEDLRTVNPRLQAMHFYDNAQVIEVSNKPTEKELDTIFEKYNNPVITLHGWLRIMPESLCNKYEMYNGHPGLITKYPELKGKDPQVRAFEAKHEVAGCVLHKVTPGVDEGKVLMEEKFNTWELELNELFLILKDRSLYMWTKFLRKVL